MVNASSNARSQNVRLNGKSDEYRRNVLLDMRKALLLLGVGGTVCKQLESSYDALYVGWWDNACALRVDFLQFAPQRFGAMHVREGVPLVANSVADLLSLGKFISIDCRSNVESGPAS